MNNESHKHLITELGVLKSFSVGKKLSLDSIREFKNKIKKTAKNSKEAESLLRKIIIRDSKKTVDISSIPGIIIDEKSSDRQKTEKKLLNLTCFSSIITKKISEKKFTKFDMCYIINVLVNMLNLSEEDFEKFHQQFNDFKNGDSEEL